jgi:hypothetical protein
MSERHNQESQRDYDQLPERLPAVATLIRHFR